MASKAIVTLRLIGDSNQDPAGVRPEGL